MSNMKNINIECEQLAEEILKNIELNELPMQQIIYKGIRLYRLLKDDEMFKLFSYEGQGYPSTPDGIPHRAFEIARKVNRIYKENEKELCFTDTIAVMEASMEANKVRLSQAKDPNISISSANEYQRVMEPKGNAGERNSIINNIILYSRRIEKVKGSLYNIVLNTYYSLHYINDTERNVAEIIGFVGDKLASICPNTISKFNSCYENLLSGNGEDWANAVNSCRRILFDVADNLYPPRKDITVNGKKIKLGQENYINRLVQYISSKENESQTYKKIIGSTLEYIGNQIDSIYGYSNKGTHNTVDKIDAERYMLYTYLLLGDILRL